MRIMILLLVLLIAGCTSVVEYPNVSQNISKNITVEKNISENISINNTVINITVQNVTNATTNIVQNATPNSTDIAHTAAVSAKLALPPTDYQGNPLDLFKSNSIVIFGNSGSLVAATINLESYIGTANYLQDDGGTLPDKNVILMGNCTNSYIAKLINCDIKEGVYLRLFKKNNYVLIIYANNPSDIFNAISTMIKPDFTMREKI